MTLTPEREAHLREWWQAPWLDEVWAEIDRLRALLTSNDTAYERGENSGYADWVGALLDTSVRQPEGGWTPTEVAKRLEATEAEIDRLRGDREKLADDVDTLLESNRRLKEDVANHGGTV